MQESQVTYAVCRKDKGILSRSLAYDLFDNDEFASKVKVITVCPMCFKECLNSHYFICDIKNYSNLSFLRRTEFLY